MARLLIAGYALTVFVGALLLFQVEPLIAKIIVPWFGGCPSVWTTCMLVFQLLLFVGYAYAHATTRLLSPRGQMGLHLVILVAAVAMLPIAPGVQWKPSGEENPCLRIVLILLCSVGAPFFVLSSTGPLLQAWFSRVFPDRSPYRLYAISNAGSLLALVSYPFVVEPNLPVGWQTWGWSGMFAAYAVLCGAIAVVSQKTRVQETAPASIRREASVADTSPRAADILLWFALAAIPSVMLLATTNIVCLDIASVPFLWVLPLALYLVSFVLCFDGTRWYRRIVFGPALAIAAGSAVVALNYGALTSFTRIVAMLLTLFAVAMFCHGELAGMKPPPRYLTLYFLVIAGAGAVGGMFVSLLAPLLFTSFIEFHLGLLAALAVGLVVCFRDRAGPLFAGRPRWAWGLLLLYSVGVAAGLGYDAFVLRARGKIVCAIRNFYGVLRVREAEETGPDDRVRILDHGNTRHGMQFLRDEKRREPTEYYSEATGIGLALRHYHSDRPVRRLGVVGLGVGTLAAYARPGDVVRFYEIDPDVLRVARGYFTFLDDCQGRWECALGDARLSLETELARGEPQRFDVLAIDAFSSDSIPVHLLTREAVQVYLAHLLPDGILAFHISNRHLNLRPVLAALAAHSELASCVVDLGVRRRSAWSGTCWVLTSRDAQVFRQNALYGYPALDARKQTLWTDDFCSLLAVMENWQWTAPVVQLAGGEHYDRGVERLKQNRLDDAEAEFRRAIEVNARDADAWMRLGDTLRKKSDPAAAAKCYEKAIELNPGFSEAYNNLGCMLVLLHAEAGRPSECFRRAIRIDPASVEAHINLAMALARQGNADEAIQHYQIALTLNPRLEQIQRNLAALLATKKAGPSHAGGHSGTGKTLAD